jgi:putative holliday junction resolvase
VGRVLGIDYGERRVGLAVSDPTATLAQPLPTLLRRRGKRPPVAPVLALIREWEVEAVVLGLPLDLAGSENDWTREVRGFGDQLARRGELPVHYQDERLTSVQAERSVRGLGLKKAAREQKGRFDAAAAMLILQAYLDRKPRV